MNQDFLTFAERVVPVTVPGFNVVLREHAARSRFVPNTLALDSGFARLFGFVMSHLQGLGHVIPWSTSSRSRHEQSHTPNTSQSLGRDDLIATPWFGEERELWTLGVHNRFWSNVSSKRPILPISSSNTDRVVVELHQRKRVGIRMLLKLDWKDFYLANTVSHINLFGE